MVIGRRTVVLTASVIACADATSTVSGVELAAIGFVIAGPDRDGPPCGWLRQP